MTKDEALDLALEALELNNEEWKALADSGDYGYWKAEDQDHYKQANEAITAIKQARSAPVQPMAHIVGEIDHAGKVWKPAQRPWFGLTDEEVAKIVDEQTTDNQGYDIWCDGQGVARAIEAKLKEKNT